MSKFNCLVLFVVAVSFRTVNAVTEEEKTAFRETMKPIVAECSQSHGVNPDEIESAKKAGNPNTLNPCFLGCVFKKTEILNGQGMYDLEAGLTKLKQFVKSDADFEKFANIGKKCASVNEQAVSDGEAGCERAKLLLACFLENKAEIPL